MSKLEEIKKRAYGTSKEDESNEEEKKKSSQSVLERIKSRIDGTYDGGISLPTVNSWFKGVEETSKGLSEYYKANEGKWVTDYGADFTNSITNLRSNADAVGHYLRSHKNEFNDYDSLYKSYSDSLSYLDEVEKQNASMRDFYSQFANEDEYNGWLDYKAKLDFDLVEGKAEIDKLESELENELKSSEAEKKDEEWWEKIGRWLGSGGAVDTTLPMATANMATTEGANERIHELKALISQKKAYYTLAERAQKASELASVADVNSELYDPKFDEYSTLGNHISWENVGDKTNKNGIAIYDDVKAAALVMNERWLGQELYTEDMVKPKSGIAGYFEGLKGLSEYNTENTEKINIFRKMSDNELKTFAYYLKKDEETGSNLAEEYIDSIKEGLNVERGKDIAASKETDFSKYLFGVEAGLDQFFEGRDALFSDADYIPTSATQAASGIVRESLADSGIPLWYNFKTGEWEDKILGSSSGQIFYDWTTTTSNMLPSILASTAINAVAPGAGTVAGSVLLGASAGGNAKAEMLNLGYSKEQATAYGIMVGVAEGSMEYFLGHIPGLSKGDGIFSTLAGKALSKVDNALARAAIALGGSMADEALEEGLQTIIEPWLKEAATSVDWDDPSVDEVLYSSLLGALSALGLGGSTAINTGINTVLKNQAIKKHGQTIIDKGGVDPLRELALEVAGVDQYAIEERTRDQNKLAKLAGKVEKKASAKNVGKLSAQLETTITEQNRADIESALVEKGLSEKEAKVAVKDIVGGELTTAEKSMIESDHFQTAIDAVLVDSDLNVSNGMAKLYEARLGKDATTSTDSPSVEGNKSSVTENPTAKEVATEGKFEVSEDGKTYIKETDKSVSVEEIVSNEGGKLMVKLDSGETVNASDLEFGTAGEAMAYEMVAEMGVAPKTAWGLVKAYDPSSGVKPQTFAIDMPLAYQYGKIGYVKGLERLNLTPEQRNTAYVLGRDDVKANGRTWSDTSRKTPETNKSKAAEDGIIYDGFELNEDSLTDIQKASLAGIRTLAKLSPSLEIHITQSSVDANGKKYLIVNGKKQLAKNGVFRNGNEIYIDLNAGKGATGTMLYTVSHEVVHFIAENSYEDFKALADFLFEHYGENNVPVDSLIKREIDKLKKGYKSEGKALPGEKVLYMKAYEEVVANAMSKMFADPTSYEKLAKLKSENFDLWKKIGEAIKHILNKLKSLLGIYEGRTPDAMAAHYVDDFSIEVYNKLQDLYLKGFVNAEANYEASIGSRNLEDFADAKNTEGESLFQYKAMEADEDTYREMLKKWGKMTDSQISNLFLTIDNAMELIKDNLEALDYAWEADIDDRAFSPVKPNSDKLYQVSLDYSTLCRKRILQQTIIAHLQEALNKPLTREEGIAIRDALIALQEEGRQIEVACALCYVESARMKSPEQIKRFIDNREAVIKEFFAGKSGGDIKANIKKAEDDTRERLHKENPNGIKGKDGKTMLDPRTAKLKQLPQKYAEEIREAKRAARASYVPTAEEQRIIEVAKGMTVSDFTSPEGLENLAKNYPSLFDAYTSYVRNATKSKGIENDTWWRAGDSMQIGDVLIANMNRENGLRSQSWSDFQVIHILDYIASTIELATRETKEQAYTKVPDYAELMGKTGVMINLSLIPTAKFNGTLDYDSVEGMDYKRALELRDKYHATVGTICIGVDNVQIKMLLGDITIDYVIPYHKSGMSAAIRKLMHIPTWSQYEEYQSEKNLSRADAESQAKKYGVKLLDESDPNYHKGTSFSKWFDLKEAQQIAKMENANPSDKAKQKKYGVMYGGYMAMQNAANNYLKLCAERGISPKFSHEKADFTAEENYWKLLIDRKMVDNITGEVIEQQTIKPIFDEKEVMRILNDELERYPKVKADQDYAIRKVTEGMLSGKIKGGMSAKDIAKVMQTPVDNVTKTNIMASAESDELYSVDDDFEEDSLDKYRQNSYNLYTTTNEYQREVTLNDKHSFARFLADETSEMADGDYKLLYIRCYDKIYCFSADGYMRGRIVHSKYVNKKKNKERSIDEYSRTWINKDREIASLWAEPVQGEQGGYEGDSAILGGRGRSDSYDTLSEDPSERYTARYTERERQTFETKEEIDEIVKKLREMYGLDDNKHSDGATGDVLYSTDDDTDSITEADVEKSFEAIWDDIVESTHGKYKNVKDFLRNETDYEMVDYWSGMYDVLDEDVFDAIPFAKVEGLWNDGSDNWKEKWTLGDILEAYQNGTLHKIKFKSNVETQTETAPKTWREEAESLRDTLLEGLSLQGREEIPSIESLMSLENPELTLVRVIHNDYRREGKRYSLVHKEVGRLDEIAYQLRDLLKGNEDKLFSAQDPDSFSNRSLLANALESVAQNDIERNKLNEYKSKIALIESEQAKLSEIRGKIKELSFAKGPRDTEAIKKLQFEANQSANRINTYDRQLLNLESTAALKGVLQREKELARRKEAQKGKEALAKYREKAAKTQRELLTRYQESRKKGIEGRHKTEMRHKIKDVVNELNQYLTKGTKEKHVPIELQKAVAEALDAVNMDTVGAEERLAEIHAKLQKDPFNHELLERYRRIAEQGERMDAKLSRLKTAYDSIINSDDPLIANSHDDVISSSIDKVIEVVGNTPLRDMSLYQLEAVYDLYKMVLTSVRNANKAFKAAKNEEISTIANRVMEEIDKLRKNKLYRTKAEQAVAKFDWNNLKPVYAFARIGSDTFAEVFDNVRAGEDTWAVDITEAKDFSAEQRKIFKYDSWDFKKRYGFTSSSGMRFELSLDQIMSLYAYSKREQAKEHLKKGGIVFDETTEVTIKTKLGIPVKFNPTQATAYNLSDETLADIIGKLTPEQKAFVDAMQDYLSTTMGEKGNEISLALYGVKLYKEKNYFPLKSATQFMAKAKEQQNGEVKIKNSGFSKETTPNASNPIVLTPFMDVWANHVNEMSMYHAFVLPLEDFYRVFNYKTPTSDTMATESVEMFLQNTHGKAAVQYIDQLLKDLNGGARVDPTVGFINKMIGLFKKSAVFTSASVVIQQPSAIGRATALVDAKYFVGEKVTKGKHKQVWAEVKKYAPVAVIKEMGYFDTNMGLSTKDYILSKEHDSWWDLIKRFDIKGLATNAKDLVVDSNYRDEVLSKAPALADELAWCAIWNAVKRETLHTHKDLKPNSEEYLKAVGERFTEVITMTQVYDSTLSRSGNMRSKDTGMKMATAFMAEPTTSLNMLENALIQGKKGNKRDARKAVGAVVASMILNSILVSFVYAGRDDDEDKTYVEKYIGTLTEELLDSLNPLTLIPFVKDIISIVQGYDVERSDMAVITDIIKAWSDLENDNRSVYRKVEDFAGSIASLFGLPVKNIMRDVRAMYNTINSFINGEKTTGAGIKNAITEAVTGDEISNGQQLYEAMLNGDTEQIERVKGRFKDQNAINSALRTALIDNDPRIQEAVMAHYDGDVTKRADIIKEIAKEGFFTQDLVQGAVNNAITNLNTKVTNAINAKNLGKTSEYKKIVNELLDKYPKDFVEKKLNDTIIEDEDEIEGKEASLYSMDDYYTTILNGNTSATDTIFKALVNEKLEEGYLQVEAESQIASSFSTKVKEAYIDGDITRAKAVSLLVSHGNKSKSEAETEVKKCDFELKHNVPWSERARAYRLGKLSKSTLRSAVMDIEGKTWEDAEAYIRFLDLEKNNPTIDITASDAASYFKYAEPVGIGIETYLNYKDQTKGLTSDKDKNGNSISGSKKKKVMAVINSLPISSSQKDALYLAEGWAKDKLYEAPWH